jgi:hypothetical protein
MALLHERLRALCLAFQVLTGGGVFGRQAGAHGALLAHVHELMCQQSLAATAIERTVAGWHHDGVAGGEGIGAQLGRS